MAYVCELDTAHQVYLDNQGNQTIITISSILPGQQQQATSSLTTGSWRSPPEAFRTGTGVVFKISTTQGEHFLQIQGNHVSVMADASAWGEGQPIQVRHSSTIQTPSTQPMIPIQSIPPMQPMKMGDMSMTMNPMAMQMGTMAMHIGTSASAGSHTPGSRRFCSQCGSKITPEDRFCSQCGHQLS